MVPDALAHLAIGQWPERSAMTSIPPDYLPLGVDCNMFRIAAMKLVVCEAWLRNRWSVWEFVLIVAIASL